VNTLFDVFRHILSDIIARIVHLLEFHVKLYLYAVSFKCI
jgi:hypothetical protein